MATRKFQLLGSLTSDAIASGSIAINGVEVYNGTLNETDGILVEGSADINDSTEIALPVSIFIATGDVLVGTLNWNYGKGKNPLLTPEEESYIIPAEISESGFTAPFRISSTITPEISARVATKGGFFLKTESYFSTGDTDELHNSNRSNLKIDGVTVDGPSWYAYLVPPGSTLTYDVTISPRS